MTTFTIAMEDDDQFEDAQEINKETVREAAEHFLTLRDAQSGYQAKEQERKVRVKTENAVFICRVAVELVPSYYCFDSERIQ